MLFISLLHISMTGPFTDYLYPIIHIHDRSLYWLFAFLLHIYMTGPFTGYLHPITHIHDRSLYWLFAFLIHIYMTGLCTGYLHPYYTYTLMTLYFLERYEDLQSKIKYQNKATYLHNIHEVVHERDQQVYG
jgi:hypothetical protein